MMISSEMKQRFHLNRLSEKICLTLQDLNGKMSISSYQGMIDSLFNFYSFHHQFSLFQYCIELKLQQATIYLSRTYLDIVIKKHHQLLISNLKLACICCVWIGIKYNQQTRFSSFFTSQIMVSHGDTTFNQAQLIAMEKQICQLLNFKFAYTTPLQYSEPFFSSFPWFFQINKVLCVLSSFTLSIADLSWQSAEDIFYGMFIASLRIKKITMNSIQLSTFREFVKSIEKIKEIAEKITNFYITALGQQDELINEPEKDILLMLN